MFQAYEMPNTKCVVIANHSLDQYTHYNLQRSFAANYTPEQLNWLRQLEKLHHQYLTAKSKKICIKKVYSTETYLLYSKGDTFIFAVIDQNGAEREAIEIGR
jgi:hypothetical protein